MSLANTDLLMDYDLPTSPYFMRSDYLQSDFNSGVIRTRSGHRVIVLPEDMIVGIHQALEYETGRAWGLIAYLCGCRWGERLLATVRQEWRHFHQNKLEYLDFEVFRHWFREYFAHRGWGDLQFDFSMEDEGLVQIWLSNSILDRLLTDMAGGYVNEIFCGLIATWISWFAGQELECLEVESPQLDADRARLVIGLRPRVEAARKVRATGGDAQAMLEALRSTTP